MSEKAALETELEKLQRRDRLSCEKLVRENYQAVYAQLFRLVGDREHAADLTQETFRKVWQSIESFRGDCEIGTWLYRLAYNVRVDWQRRNNRDIQCQNFESQSGPLDLSPSAEPDSRLLAEDERNWLTKYIDQLIDHHREVIELHYFKQLTIKETAEALGVAVGTTKSRLNQAPNCSAPISAGRLVHAAETIRKRVPADT